MYNFFPVLTEPSGDGDKPKKKRKTENPVLATEVRLKTKEIWLQECMLSYFKNNF